MRTNITIDKEFEQLIPPLTDKEYQGLEESIRNEGCRDPIVVWDNIIIEGHNRFKICNQYSIPYKTVEKSFATREDAKLWMIKNQLSRRNINNYARVTLESMSEEIINKQKQAKANLVTNIKKDKKVQDEPFVISQKATKDQKVNTTKELAKKAKVGQQTASHVMTINKKIEEAATENKTIAGYTPEELKRKLITDNITINEAYNKIKLEEKKETILAAEKKKVEQASDKHKPILYVGDGIKFIPTEKYDLLLTDPPYSTDIDNIDKFVNDWLYKALDNVKDTGFAYVFIGNYPEEVKAYLCANTPEHIKLQQILVWRYDNTLAKSPKDKYDLNCQFCLFYRGINSPDPDFENVRTEERLVVQTVNAPDGRQGNRYHAWQKPMEIAERFIRHSTTQDMTVFDPFACTGTFLLAAAKLGRKSYGFEINPEHAKIAFERGCLRG